MEASPLIINAGRHGAGTEEDEDSGRDGQFMRSRAIIVDSV